MRIMNLLVILLAASTSNVLAFWGGNSWSPFGNSNSNWSPFSTGLSTSQWSPKNDAANMSRYGAYPRSLMQYKKNPKFVPSSTIPEATNLVQPSNWLVETDFTSTLEKIKDSSKTFFVNETSDMGFVEDYKRIQKEASNINKEVRNYINNRTGNLSSTDYIYGKQGYAISPAAASTAKIERQ